MAGSLKPVESRKRVDLGTPVDGRRFGSGKSSPLTRGRRKRSWFLESVRGLALWKATGRDRERQRSDVSLAHGRKSHAEVAPPEAVPGSTKSKGEEDRVRIGRSWRRAVKHAPSRGRIAARRSGVARKNPTPPQGGAGEASCGQRSASCAPGSRAVYGCSCRQSVAEVGERHLLRAIEGSREANQDCTE